ncbi:GFA family protein [Thalassococcus sp. S3]|uniref:GFA family protein n=1 Tax=Thalassococcus sp. S3 TaxID=2017482 RepID=UPI00102437CC|nr:GFA family protein [Thalassococcus sp. S3]QBF32034.1 aldehyde-activating protein [Thalassococcus sp. S3]
MTGRCLCGTVRVTLTARPEFIHDCNCSLCRKSGGAWGYFPGAQVRTEGSTNAFLRKDKTGAAAELQSCPTCATTTHWVFAAEFQDQNPDVDLVGVNMRLFDPEDLEGIELRFPNGRDWSGQGAFGYRHAPVTLGKDVSL